MEINSKKLLRPVFSFFLAIPIFFSSPAAVYAKNLEYNNSYDDVITLVNDANNLIQEEIDKAVAEADKITKEYNAALLAIDGQENYNLKSKKLEHDYNKALDKIENRLVKETSKISNKTIKSSSASGIEIKCQIIMVKLGNREVPVDPLIIIGY